MLVSDNWLKETAKEIISEFEELLSEHNIKIENEDIKNNIFSNNSNINKKEYDEVKSEIERILKNFADYVEYISEKVA